MDSVGNNNSGMSVPPQAVDVERQVIGAMLLDPNAIAICAEKLIIEDFYLEKHQILFSAILKMSEKGREVDILTLTDEAEKQKVLSKIGGEGFLMELSAEVVSSANVGAHCEIVKEKAIRRRLIETSNNILRDCYDTANDTNEILDSAESYVYKIGESQISKGLSPIKSILNDTFNLIESYASSEITGVTSGFKELDYLTGGFQKSDLIVLAGRPAMGKTAVTLCMMMNAAIQAGKTIAFFSLEMAKEQLVQRLLCREGRIPLQQLRTGRLPKRDYARLADSAGRLHKTNIYIDDNANQSSLQIRSKCRRLAQQIGGLDMVIIDYLQLMSSPGKVENRQQEISQISRSLKGLAKEMNIPVIALSQLNRSVESRGGDGRPMIHDLRESGAIEQDADIVMFVYRPEMYNDTDQSLKGLAELIIAKQRNGPTGLVKLSFIKEYASFENYTERMPEGEGF